MAVAIVTVNTKGEAKKFVFGFFNPCLFGVYVFIIILGAIIGLVYYSGYGCWLRAGSFLFTYAIPVICILFMAVVLAGWLQVQIWKRVLKQTEANGMPLVEMLANATIVAFIILPLCAGTGAKIREVRIQQICKDCNVLITDLETERKLHGAYSTNIVDLVKSHADLRRRYFFYYAQTGTNGIEWSADKIAEASVSLFVTTNSYQLVVPIEKMSPISFSSFYVYSYTSEHPSWDKTKLHWFIGGAFIDDPER